MKKILLIALVLITGSAKMAAQKQDNAGWNRMGGSTVNLKSQTEEILIADGDKYKSIKLSVTEAPIFLESFDIHFANGDTQTVEYGGYDPIELNGSGRRAITKITLRYKSIDDSDKRAHVELLGMKSSDTGSKIAAK